MQAAQQLFFYFLYRNSADLTAVLIFQALWPRLFLDSEMIDMKPKGWLAIATLKPTFTFLVGILPSKSIEYGKISTKKSESWF